MTNETPEMNKCVDCGNPHNYKLFNQCNDHLLQSFEKVLGEMVREAFPEMNGLPIKEPQNPYAKFIRSLAGDWK